MLIQRCGWVACDEWCAVGGRSAAGRKLRGWAESSASDVEAERPELLAAILGDLVGTPRRQPDPVDPEVVDQALKGHSGLVLDHVGQRAGGAGQRHVDGR